MSVRVLSVKQLVLNAENERAREVNGSEMIMARKEVEEEEEEEFK